MIQRRRGTFDGELSVLISLVVSVGMIILALTTWWLWRILTYIGNSSAVTRAIEIP